MKTKFLAALAAGTMLASTAHAVTTFDDLAAWQAAAGTWTNDTDYGTELDDISALTLDDGTELSFSGPVNIRQIGSSWATWSGGYAGQVLFSNDATSITINFDTPVGGFGLFAEPDPFEVHSFLLTLSDGSTIGGDFNGDAGAGFLGFVGSDIVSATLSSDVGFAFGDFYVTDVADAVPEPATWAMMIGGFALAGAAMRRRSAAVRFA